MTPRVAEAGVDVIRGEVDAPLTRRLDDGGDEISRRQQPIPEIHVVDHEPAKLVDAATIHALMMGAISTRAVRLPEDADLLLSVYASTRPELCGPGWPDELVRMQFEAQSRHYGAFHPHAESTVVLVDGEPAGRLIVERAAAEIRIVDIALLPAFRGVGVGGRLVRALVAEADSTGRPLRCHVEMTNDARGFWEHLGLVARGLDGAHVEMERACATSRP